MNHQSLKAKLGSRSGVTLVELLVVILIVTILSVTLLPMFKKYVVQAQYAAEPIPLVAHLRTQIGLYQYEHSDLPGKTGVVHTYNVVAAADKVKQYTPVIGGVGCIRNAKTFALQAFTTATGSTSTSEHFMKAMDLTTDELVGRRMTPLHVEYVNFGCNGSSYAYALGVFGDGNDLPKGTGYATFEFFAANVVNAGSVSDDKGAKVVGTWSNYSGIDAASTGGQVFFDETDATTHCFITGGAALDDTAIGTVQAALKDMTDSGGWKFSK